MTARTTRLRSISLCWQSGFAERDVKLVILREIAAHQDHAIIAVRFNGGWIVLDNRWLALIHDFELRRAEPLYILDEDGVKRLASGRRDRLPVCGLDKVQRPMTGMSTRTIECALKRS